MSRWIRGEPVTHPLRQRGGGASRVVGYCVDVAPRVFRADDVVAIERLLRTCPAVVAYGIARDLAWWNARPGRAVRALRDAIYARRDRAVDARTP